MLTAILVITFWNFTMFWYRSDSPRNVISSMVNLAYELTSYNSALALAVKKHAKINSKPFLPRPILLGFQVPRSGLQPPMTRSWEGFVDVH